MLCAVKVEKSFFVHTSSWFVTEDNGEDIDNVCFILLHCFSGKMHGSKILRTPLSQWHAAIIKLPTQERFLKGSKNQKFLAWCGDKILSKEVAFILLDRSRTQGPKGKSKLGHRAVSNDHIASMIFQLLPSKVCPSFTKESIKGRNSKTVTNMVEAAVAEVSNTSNGKAAIRELSEWLLHAADQ